MRSFTFFNKYFDVCQIICSFLLYVVLVYLFIIIVYFPVLCSSSIFFRLRSLVGLIVLSHQGALDFLFLLILFFRTDFIIRRIPYIEQIILEVVVYEKCVKILIINWLLVFRLVFELKF